MVANAGERGKETVDQIRVANADARFGTPDVSLPSEMVQTVHQTVEAHGDLHMHFNGAGFLATLPDLVD